MRTGLHDSAIGRRGLRFAAPLLFAMGVSLSGAPLAAQDAARGEAVFKKCAACHAVGPGAKHRVGPNLTGVVGRRAGSAKGYGYSKSMRAAGGKGLVWSEAALFDYLADPSKFLQSYLGDGAARAKMPFRLKSSRDRRDVIAYLATFRDQARRVVPNGDAAEVSQASALSSAGQPAPAQVCVTNAGQARYHFVAEAAAGARVTADLSPGEQLCAQGDSAEGRGVVSVFETTDHLEGCSRLVPMGQGDVLLRYVDFDRCEWASHS